MADEKAKPEAAEKTCQELLAYLKESGTGAQRCQKVETYLARYPRATAAEVVEHMASDGVQPGTVEKAGKWLYGSAYSYRGPEHGAVTLDKELANERAQNAALRLTIKALESKNHSLLKANTQLRQQPDLRSEATDEQKLPDERPTGKRALAGAGAR